MVVDQDLLTGYYHLSTLDPYGDIHENHDTPTNSDVCVSLGVSIETNCRETLKFSDLDKFLNLDWDFLVLTLMWRQNREALISTEISQLSRRTFWPCQNFLDSQDAPFDDVEIETLNRDMIETNRDPQAYIYVMLWIFWNFPFFTKLVNS
jgi:hypothetical protein